MDCRTECLADLSSHARELYDALACRYALHGKSLLLKPCCDCLNVSIGRPKLLSEFGWREPMMEVRRSRRLLLFEQLVQRSLLLRRARKQEHHALCRKAIRRRSPVELRLRKRMNIAAQNHAAVFVNGPRHPRTGRRLLGKTD
jgi:hypothetical protein